MGYADRDWQVNGLRDLLRECRSHMLEKGMVWDECFPSMMSHEHRHADLLYRIDCALRGKRQINRDSYFGAKAGDPKSRYAAP